MSTYYLAPLPPSRTGPPYTRTPPVPPSRASKPVAVACLTTIQEIARRYPDWREPGPNEDHTEVLALWLRLLDDLKGLRSLLAQLDAPDGKGASS